MATQATININVNSKQAQDSVDKLSQSINNAGGTASSLRAQLRQVTQELQNLEPGSKRFQELSTRAGQLRDQIQDTNAVITATAGNVTENFGKALGNTIQLGVAGFQAMTSAQVLFGSENEELNKTLAKMGALLNLSQAITTFGGLSDKLTEIKAGFTPFLQQLGLMKVAQTETAVASGAAAVAMEGEAVAAGSASVATGAFATALNALPLVAIVTAIGLLVAGLVSYGSSTGDASDGTEKLTASQKELQAQNKKNAEGTLSEINGFRAYITILSQTTAGSKERAKVIDDINSKYGTTLKNLADEEAFQMQLNNAVINYIALQKARFQLKGQEDALAKSFEREALATSFLTSYQAELTKLQSRTDFNNDILQTIELKKKPVQGQQALIDKEKEFQLEVGKKTQSIIQQEQNALKSLGITNDKNAKGNKTNTDSKIEDAKKYSAELDKLNGKYERELKVLETQDKFRSERIAVTLDKEIESINQLYGDERQAIIDRAIQGEIDALDKKYEEGTLKIEKGLSKDEQYAKNRKKIQDDFDTYLLDSERKLLVELEGYRQEDIEKTKNNYSLKEQLVKETTQNILTTTQQLQLEYEKSESIRQIEESQKTEEEKEKAKLEVRQKYAQKEIDLLNKSLDEQKRIAKLNLDQTLQDDTKTLSEKEQAQADYDKKIVEMTQQTADKINEINAGVKPPLDEKSLEKSLEKINEYVDAIATAYSSLSTTIGMIQDARSEKEETRIQGQYDFEKQALENQLTENIITRDEYDNKLKELDQQREQETLQLRRQEFQTNKRLNMANAVIAGAQAVLQALGSAPPPINIILAALVGGLAAAQFGIISSQEFTAAGGGIVPGFGSGMVDTVPARLAPGETVINAQSSAMYPELLNSINMAGGGISLKPDLPATNSVNPEVKLFGDNKSNQPIRAYVVETELTDTQKRIDRIKRSAEF